MQSHHKLMGFCFFCLAVCCNSLSYAEDADPAHFYFSAQLGSIEAELSREAVGFGDGDVDDNSGLASVALGYQINRHFGVELGYLETITDLVVTFGDEVTIDGFYLAAVGTQHLTDRIFLRGSIGYGHWDADIFPFNADSDKEFIYKVGIGTTFAGSSSLALNWLQLNADLFDMKGVALEYRLSF